MRWVGRKDIYATRTQSTCARAPRPSPSCLCDNEAPQHGWDVCVCGERDSGNKGEGEGDGAKYATTYTHVRSLVCRLYVPVLRTLGVCLSVYTVVV